MSIPALDTAPDVIERVVAEPRSGVRVEQTAMPVPALGQVLVRTSFVGICGSDTHAIAGHHPFLTSTYLPGHEASGTVAELGEGTTGFVIGQRVLLKPNVACGKCVNCVAGRSNACEFLTWIGCDPSLHWAGAMAGYFVAPAGNLYAIPDNVDDETAAIVECLATPVHAARIAGDLRGARVVVLGAGTIGMLCIVAALHAGAEHVVVTDLDDGKLARARRIGAQGAVRASDTDADDQVSAALAGSADVVLDCVANEHSFAQAVRLLRRAGSLIVVGVPARNATLPMPLIQDWEIRVQGCAGYTESDVETALHIAAQGALPSSELISSTFSLAAVSEAFVAAAADSSGKVLVAPHLR